MLLLFHRHVDVARGHAVQCLPGMWAPRYTETTIHAAVWQRDAAALSKINEAALEKYLDRAVEGVFMRLIQINTFSLRQATPAHWRTR